MISNRFTEEQIEVDALRMIVNRSLILPVNILVNGHGQIGKSTFVYYLANRILQIKKHILRKNATWKEWDYKKFSTTTPQDFVRVFDENDNAILNLSEGGEQLNYLEWFSIMGKVFSSITRTQGISRNICIMDTPMSGDIMKHAKENVDFRFWVKIRDDDHNFSKVVPRFVKIDYLRDKWKLGFILDWNIYYSPKFLLESNKFTDYLKEFKGDIMEKNKERVGLFTKNPMKPEWY